MTKRDPALEFIDTVMGARAQLSWVMSLYRQDAAAGRRALVSGVA
jgi:hypothetical protein